MKVGSAVVRERRRCLNISTSYERFMEDSILWLTCCIPKQILLSFPEVKTRTNSSNNSRKWFGFKLSTRMLKSPSILLNPWSRAAKFVPTSLPYAPLSSAISEIHLYPNLIPFRASSMISWRGRLCNLPLANLIAQYEQLPRQPTEVMTHQVLLPI